MGGFLLSFPAPANIGATCDEALSAWVGFD
jgi:hypothetical protein